MRIASLYPFENLVRFRARFILLLLLLTAGGILSPLLGQGVGEERFSGTIRLLLLFEPPPSFEAPPDPPVIQISRAAGESAVFNELEWTAISRPVSLSGGRTLEFFTRESSNSFRKISEIRMPEPTGDWLLVFLPEEGSGFRVVPVDVAAGVWPEGKVLFVNFGDASVAAEVAGEVKRMAPGEKWLVDNSVAENFQLRTQVAAQHKDRMRLVYSSSFAIGPEARVLFVIHRREMLSGPWTVSTFSYTEKVASQDDAPPMDDAPPSEE